MTFTTSNNRAAHALRRLWRTLRASHIIRGRDHKAMDGMLDAALLEEKAATVERIRQRVYRREHEYDWSWDADQWTQEDMNHSAAMIGDFLAILYDEWPEGLSDVWLLDKKTLGLPRGTVERMFKEPNG